MSNLRVQRVGVVTNDGTLLISGSVGLRISIEVETSTKVSQSLTDLEMRHLLLTHTLFLSLNPTSRHQHEQHPQGSEATMDKEECGKEEWIGQSIWFVIVLCYSLLTES